MFWGCFSAKTLTPTQEKTLGYRLLEALASQHPGAGISCLPAPARRSHSSPGNAGVEAGALLRVLPQCQSASPNSAFSISKASPRPALGTGLREGLLLMDEARLSSVLRRTQPLPQHCKHRMWVNTLREFCRGRLQMERK